MIITKVVSGLGNQLFQWAAGRSLAQKNGTEVLLDISFFSDQTFSYHQEFPRPFKLNRFRLRAGIASAAQVAAAPDFQRLTPRRRRVYTLLRNLKLRRFTPRIKEQSFGYHPEILALGDNVYLEGYWASEKYFTSIAPLIREEARVADRKIEDFAQRYIQQRRKPGIPVIGVQVRRGDIYYLCEVLKKPEMAPTPLLQADYFIRAMQYFGDHCTFLMFSDSEKDLRLCQEEFKGCKNITFVSGNDDITDFVILQKCDHQIISNSTFGWWAAWLNSNKNKVIIAPRGWFSPVHPTETHWGTSFLRVGRCCRRQRPAFFAVHHYPSKRPALCPMKPRIAVVIPCYNYGRFLQEAVASVLLAKRTDLELVIVDDGSTDPHTQREVARLSAEGFHVIRQPNSGVMVARNVGVRATTADYILPLDADNKVRPAYFEWALDILDREPRVGVVYGDAQKFGTRSDRWVTGAFDREKLMSINFIDACAVFRRKVWEGNDGYDASMPVQGLEDWDFWLGALSHGWEFRYVPEILFDYRIEPGSLSTQSGVKLKAVEEFIATKYGVLYRQAWMDMQRELFSLRAVSEHLKVLLFRRIRNKFVRAEKREPDRWLHRLKQPR